MTHFFSSSMLWRCAPQQIVRRNKSRSRGLRCGKQLSSMKDTLGRAINQP
jgi:hypothetical protein